MGSFASGTFSTSKKSPQFFLPQTNSNPSLCLLGNLCGSEVRFTILLMFMSVSEIKNSNNSHLVFLSQNFCAHVNLTLRPRRLCSSTPYPGHSSTYHSCSGLIEIETGGFHPTDLLSCPRPFSFN